MKTTFAVAALSACVCAHGYFPELDKDVQEYAKEDLDILLEGTNLKGKDPDSDRNFAQLTAVNGF
jgi:hypothetical protein